MAWLFGSVCSMIEGRAMLILNRLALALLLMYSSKYEEFFTPFFAGSHDPAAITVLHRTLHVPA